MVITKVKLGSILTACLLLNLAGTALVVRLAVHCLCPRPEISLDCFETIRPGMSWYQVLAAIRSREQLALEAVAVRLHAHGLKGHHVWHFRGNDAELQLETVDGILTDGRATLNGRVVRRHLEPRDPVLDPIRLVVRRLDRDVNEHRSLELLSHSVAFVASICLVGVLVAAKRARRKPG